MLWQICLVLFVIYFIQFWWKNKALRDIYKRNPCNLKSVPVLGHSVSFMGNSTDIMRTIEDLARQSTEGNGMVGLWLTNRLILLITDPIDVEYISKTCLEKDELMSLARSLIGNGSIFASVQIWRPRRKVLAHTFGQKTLNNFVKIFAKQSDILTENLGTKVGNDNFSIFDHITTYSMDSVCATTLGVDVKAQKNLNHPILKAFLEFLNISCYRMFRPWYWPEEIFKFASKYPIHDGAIKILTKFVDEIVERKRKENKEEQNNNAKNLKHIEEKSEPTTFLDLLIELSGGDKGFSNLELREETLVMVLAGTDTSALGASFTCLLLAKYPEVQEKVFQEIHEVLGESDGVINADNLPKLKYLEAAIKESLRLYPPVPVVIRTIDKNITLPSGAKLVPGVGAVSHIWGVHRNPKYWGADADAFRPERFLEGAPTHPAAFIPFSSGPRMCLGYQYALMSMKTVIGAIVRKYRLLPRNCGNTTKCAQDEPIPTKFEIMTRDVNNFEIRLECRA